MIRSAPDPDYRAAGSLESKNRKSRGRQSKKHYGLSISDHPETAALRLEKSHWRAIPWLENGLGKRLLSSLDHGGEFSDIAQQEAWSC